MIATETLVYNNYTVHIAKPDFFTTKLRLRDDNWLFKPWHPLFKKLNIGQGLTVDIGANYGVATIEFFTNTVGNRYTLFEPIAENCHCIEQTLKNSNINYTLHNVGMSNTEGTANFFFNKNMSGTSGITENNTGNRTISVKTLDSYEFNDVVFIKIDTEGHELEVIQGAMKTITEQQPVLFFEVDPKSDQQKQKLTAIFDILHSAGYVCVNSSLHRIKTIQDINIANQSANTLVANVKDLAAIPKNKFPNLEYNEINVDFVVEQMHKKLGKKTQRFHNIDFVPCKKEDKVYSADQSNLIYLNNIFFKTDKRARKIYYRHGNDIFWSFDIFIDYPVQKTSFNNLFQY